MINKIYVDKQVINYLCEKAGITLEKAILKHSRTSKIMSWLKVGDILYSEDVDYGGISYLHMKVTEIIDTNKGIIKLGSVESITGKVLHQYEGNIDNYLTREEIDI